MSEQKFIARSRFKRKNRRRVTMVNVTEGTVTLAEHNCRIKTAFETRKEAVKKCALKGMRPYNCNICGKWHITTQKKGERDDR